MTLTWYRKVEEVPLRSAAELEESINVFGTLLPQSVATLADFLGSIDEDTFRRLPDPTSGLDLMEDDLPTNLDYLDATARRGKRQTSGDSAEGLRSWQTEEDDILHGNHLAAEINGETIKMLYSGPFDMREDYWDNLPPLDAGAANE